MNRENLLKINNLHDKIIELDTIKNYIERALRGSRDKTQFGVSFSEDEPERYIYINEPELGIMLRDITFKYCNDKLKVLWKEFEEM